MDASYSLHIQFAAVHTSSGQLLTGNGIGKKLIRTDASCCQTMLFNSGFLNMPARNRCFIQLGAGY
ncbi:hypothetical protein D3C75_1355740 [compost metagenome]